MNSWILCDLAQFVITDTAQRKWGRAGYLAIGVLEPV